MKYITSYKLFESIDISETIGVLRDIFLELHDKDFDIDISPFEAGNIIYITIYKDRPFKSKDVYDVVISAIDYVNDNNFYLDDIWVIENDKWGTKRSMLADDEINDYYPEVSNEFENFDKEINTVEIEFKY